MNLNDYWQELLTRTFGALVSHLRLDGALAERLAALYLRLAGLKILARNFSVSGGELDIVALEKKCLVFTEVKYRYYYEFGDALEAVDWRKQQRILRAAVSFRKRTPKFSNYPMRFDVIALRPRQKPAFVWLKGAFDF